ncbi:4-hydroxybutyryl-CoA dehydratase/vinylacetyl-CoA-Delta-isomerase [Antricoccus suffuscus]|uniref:4-hydroxybutyryl-CoA dehydratase/vinylacetyl-CoA-Delta-isomerase n=1 Tax=Antricoccus suffuscus TaxID=1629062 RepID=A0A2T1A3Y7_9ACTN|nr:4-hydroxyphenylacetate 3-hydroxylase N-terminal domain-containing protein [Antricoccus suffuscus]PRZ43330.1 4-hydroxybutyryl-CoA dehydratase/vinylacetyl-CoA-Delta-isomerase [Antricoccus suffuscus]
MLTGDQYKASLSDGRATYFEGERVEDLVSHPILGPAVQNVADGYDWLATQAVDGQSPLSGIPTSPQDLRDKVDLVHKAGMMAHVTYTSLMTLTTAASRLSKSAPQYVDRINAFVEDAQRRDLRVTQCITDAKGDRSLSPSKQDDPDSYVRVVERRSDGVVIRGAKLHITAASFGHELMTIPTKAMRAGEEDYAIAAVIPVNAPGVKIINTTYAPRHDDLRDFPVSGIEHFPEGFVIFDDVFVPTERILLDGEVESASVFAHSLGLWERLGGLSSMADGSDVLVGLAQLIAEANGLDRVGHVKEKISEMIIHATVVRACLEAALTNAETGIFGAVFPNELYTNAGKYTGAANYNLMVRHLHDIAGGAIVTAPSRADLENPEVGDLARKYMSTRGDVDGEYRTRLFHTIRDLTADAYGGWKQVTNVQAGGGLYAQRIVTRKHYDLAAAKGAALRIAGLAESEGPSGGF